MDSSLSCTFRDTVAHYKKNPAFGSSKNPYSTLAEKFIPIEDFENPSPLKRGTFIKKPLPAIATNPIVLENLVPELPLENTLQDLQENAFTAYFVLPNNSYEDVELAIRSPLKSSCDCLFPYAYHVSKVLRRHCLERIFQWKRETITSIIKELIPHLELREISLNSLSEHRIYRKNLEKLCKDKPNFIKTSSLIRTLIKYLPLTVIAEAKIEASIFCLFLRLMRYFPSYENTPDISNIEHIKTEIQKYDLSLVEKLNLSRSYIEVLPFAICERLTNIQKLDFSNNKSSSLPLLYSLQKMPSLIELDLSGNEFTSIPLSFFESLPHLQKIDLSSNYLSIHEIKKIKNFLKKRNANTTLIS